jgi:NTP pyrophosphatase (non-canonical NTP hydrolase)
MTDEGQEERYALKDLLAVMARLRDRETGCPWDLKQDFSTIAPYTIEEAYEVADAIARDDLDALKDELGDLLLQVVYHAQIAAEESRFDFSDVADAITRKMIRRHPHVFGEPALRDELLKSRIDACCETAEAGRGSGLRLAVSCPSSGQGRGGTRRTQRGSWRGRRCGKRCAVREDQGGVW